MHLSRTRRGQVLDLSSEFWLLEVLGISSVLTAEQHNSHPMASCYNTVVTKSDSRRMVSHTLCAQTQEEDCDNTPRIVTCTH